MARVKALLLAATFVAAGAAVASAELALESVHWQQGRVEGGRVAFWKDVKTLAAAPSPVERMRARLILKNDGPQSEEGLLLRYSLTARVLPQDGGSADGSWAVSFIVDERRVPKVGAEKTIEVPLDTASAVDLYVRRALRAGWRLDRLKIQVMLEPHRGSKALQVVEDVVEFGDGTKKP
jgi:hypothetical protein